MGASYGKWCIKSGLKYLSDCIHIKASEAKSEGKKAGNHFFLSAITFSSLSSIFSGYFCITGAEVLHCKSREHGAVCLRGTLTLA